MKYFVIAGIFFVTNLVAAQAQTASVLTIQRLNYKPEKKLIYDLSFTTDCEINTDAPFDVYYVDNSSGQRLTDFSSNSRTYFSPRINPAATTPRHVALQFKALDEIQNATNTQTDIIVYLEKVDGRCIAKSEITYSNKRYIIKHIDIQMKKLFGTPSGVEWVRVEGYNESGDITDCVAGNCI